MPPGVKAEQFPIGGLFHKGVAKLPIMSIKKPEADRFRFVHRLSITGGFPQGYYYTC